MIEVIGPDGQRYQFPDSTPRETMRAAMEKRYPKQPAAPTPDARVAGAFEAAASREPVGAAPRPAGESASAFLRGAADFPTMGTADEITAGLAAVPALVTGQDA